MTIKKWSALSALIALIILFGVSACEKESSILSDATDSSLDQKLSSYEIVDLDGDAILNEVREQSGGVINLNIESLGLELEMSEYDLIPDDGECYSISGEDQLTPVEIPEIYFLYGYNTITREKVGAVVGTQHVTIHIIENGRQFLVEQAVKLDPNADLSTYVKYEQSDVIDDIAEETTCENNGDNRQQMESGAEESGARVANDICQITALGDGSWYSAVNGYISNYHASYIYENVYWGGYILWAINGHPLDYQARWVGWYNTYNPCTAYYSYDFKQQWKEFGLNASWLPKTDVNFLYTDKRPRNSENGLVAGSVIQIGASCYSSNNAFGYVRFYSGWWKRQILLTHEVSHLMSCTHNTGIMAPNTSNQTYELTEDSRDDLTFHTQVWWWCY